MSTPGLLNLLYDVNNFGNIWSECRKREIQYTKIIIINKYNYITVRSTISGTCIGALMMSRRGISLEQG